MKKLLLITYHFPPDAAVGALRPAKFAQYLPEYDWKPFVLSVKENYYERLDRGRMGAGVASDQIWRTRVWPNPGRLYRKLKEWVYSIRGKREIFEEKVNTFQSNRALPAGNGGILRQIRRVILSLLEVADGLLGWVPPALSTAFFLYKRSPIDCLYTSGPPHVAHLIGLALKKRYGTRWVADFRDPWILNPIRSAQAKSTLSEWLEQWMEKEVVTHADNIISVTDRMTQAFQSLYPQIEKTKFVTIPNGYDPDDFVGIPPPLNPNKFRMSYLGTFYVGRTPAPFLQAVQELIQEGQIQSEKLEIRFIGACRYSDGQSVEEMIRDRHLSTVVHIVDPIPHKQALAEMMASHVLLLFAPNQYYQVPAKTFEYLGTGADILALTPEGATADLIQNTGRGVVVDPDSIPHIKEAIASLYQKYQTRNWQLRDGGPSPQNLSRYHRKTLTKELVTLLG